MNTGIQDAVSLAEALVASRRSGDTAPLDAWDRERQKVARAVVSLTNRMTRAATLESPAAIEARNLLIALLGHSGTITRAVAARLPELNY